jgi:hypothetical protein
MTAGFGNQEVILNADATKIAIGFQHNIVDKISIFIFNLPTVYQLRDNVNAWFNS